MRLIAKTLMMLAVIAVMVSFGVQQASADALLFPYFKSGGGAYTFVSLQSTWGGTVTTVYNYDLLSTPATECIHEDHSGSMTAFDLAQFEVTKQVDLKTLFGDTSTTQNLHLLVPNTQGFFIVDNPAAAEGDFYGQAAIVDSASGIVTAYKALNNPVSTVRGTWSDPTVSKTSFIMSNYPDPTVSTSWFVLVTGTGMDALAGWLGQVSLTNGFALVYNRDELWVSGDKPKTITCFGMITRPDIMQAGQVTNSNNGGLWWELTTPVAGGATGALMYKFESTTALGGTKTVISPETAFPNFPY